MIHEFMRLQKDLEIILNRAYCKYKAVREHAKIFEAFHALFANSEVSSWIFV